VWIRRLFLPTVAYAGLGAFMLKAPASLVSQSVTRPPEQEKSVPSVLCRPASVEWVAQHAKGVSETAKATTLVVGAEVTTETHGVDLRPYLESSVMPLVRANWYRLVSKFSGRSSGRVTLEFTVLKDGSLGPVKLIDAPADSTLGDLAANAVRQSGPFPAMPPELGGELISVRSTFEYDAVAANEPRPAARVCYPAEIANRSSDWLMPPRAISDPEPEFTPEAREKKTQGTVTLEILVAADGTVQSACAMQPLGSGLEESAVETARKWRFEPATFKGNPQAMQIEVEVQFRLPERDTSNQAKP